MDGYTPLFSSIVTSSVWNEDDATRIVWITLLALADAKGKVEGSVSGLAPVARVAIPACEKALEVLKTPDKYSRTKEYEGRRIVDIDGGWQVLNHKKFRDKAKSRAEYYRTWRRIQKEERSKEEALNTDLNTNTNTNTNSETARNSAQHARNAENRPKRGFQPPSLEDVSAYAKSIDAGIDCEQFVNFYESKGWMVGKNKMKDWKAAVRTWKQRSQSDPQTGRKRESTAEQLARIEKEGRV